MIYKMNLLPEELRKDKKINNRKQLIRLAAYSIVGVIVIGELVYASMLASLKYKTSNLEDEINAMQPAVMQVSTLTKKNNDTKNRIAAFEKLTPDSKWANLLENISTFMTENMWLTHIYIDDKNNLIIEGHADKLSTLGNFMAGLRSIQGFKNINLLSSGGTIDGIKFILSVERGV